MSALKCPQCGAPLDASSAELACPACLLRLGLEPGPGTDENGAPGIASQGLGLPRAFGPYELIEELGRGGMGVVYRARQASLNRSVAVKLLLAGAYSSEAALDRFRLEAAAAAGLQHPNIVEIHDFGEVDGQPYYAMDLVGGPNLAELCGGRPLPARSAAELLCTLAGAVEYAHRRGILHRDLKPSNVLVGESGRPRIADFGLVKLLGSNEGATMPGQMLGSPSYAAPEQAAGRFAEIGVSSDVYGLGALFYHLVTGRAPFNAATPIETLRLVLDSEPPPPRLLNPSLPRDLETICLKCLSKDPARRYATAAEVVEDVERFLAERPIRAQPPGVWYRIAKFTRRHRAGVAATAAVMLALAGGLALALVGFRRAVIQRQAADAARAQAEQLVGVMTKDLKPVLEQRGGGLELRQVAESAVRYFDSLPPERRNTATDGQHAAALAAVARLRGLSHGDFAGAAAAMEAALALGAKVAREHPDDPAAAAALLWNEWELARISGDNDAEWSLSRQTEFLRRWRELSARFPDDFRIECYLAEVLATYAQVALVHGRKAEAGDAARQSRSLVEALVAARPDDKSLGELMVKCQDALGTGEWGAGYLGENVEALERILEDRRAALTVDPDNFRLRRQIADAARILSLQVWPRATNRAREAETIAREHYRVLLERNPGDQEIRRLFAMAQTIECRQLLLFDPQIEETRKAIRARDVLLEPFEDRKDYHGVCEARVNDSLALALLAAMAGDTAGARAGLDEAGRRFEPWHKWMAKDTVVHSLTRARYLQLVGLVEWWLRDWQELERSARETTRTIEAGLQLEPEHWELRIRGEMARCSTGIAWVGMGRAVDGVALLREALPRLRGMDQRFWMLDKYFVQMSATLALIERLAESGESDEARRLSQAVLLVRGSTWLEPWSWAREQMVACVQVSLARSMDAADTPLRIAMLDRAEATLAQAEADGHPTVFGRKAREKVEPLRTAALAEVELDRLEKLATHLDVAAGTDRTVVARMIESDVAAWNVAWNASATGSPSAREVQGAIRERCRALVVLHPGSMGGRFLLARAHRMPCFVHLAVDGRPEPAREAFRAYDVQLEPFDGLPGYEPVGQVRMINRLQLAQLAASVGDVAAVKAELAEARRRYAVCLERLESDATERRWLRARFLQEAAWCAWWQRDWGELGRAAHELLGEIETGRTARPDDDELQVRLAYARGFAALALQGEGRHAEALPLLREARKLLYTCPPGEGAWDRFFLIHPVQIGIGESLRQTGSVRSARNWAEQILSLREGEFPRARDSWYRYKRLAELQIVVAGLLDPSVPAEAMRRAELLNRASRLLAPANVEGRLTVDVQELLAKIANLRGVGAIEGSKTGSTGDGYRFGVP